MATTIGSFTSKPAGSNFKKWAEATLIGMGVLGLFVLVIALYLGLAF